MQVLNTTLVLGPYDWDAEVMPRTEFDARVAAVRRTLAAHEANALLVYGDTFDNGALSYLTNFTPKLNAALALFPCEGKPVILFSGGPAIVEASQRMTWVDDLRAIGQLKANFEQLFDGIAGGRELVLGVWETGRMAAKSYRALQTALQGRGRMIEVQDDLEKLRRRKSPCELAAMRRASKILSGTTEHLKSEFDGKTGARTLALAAERAAFSLGAQDARVMTSLREGGAPAPVDTAADICFDPLLVSIAVRFEGYYAEGHLTLTHKPLPVAEAANAGMQAMIRAARAGVSGGALAHAADQALNSAKARRVEVSCVGVGLSLEEAPWPSEQASLEAGDVCCFKVEAGSADEASADTRALASAMVLVGENGAEVL